MCRVECVECVEFIQVVECNSIEYGESREVAVVDEVKVASIRSGQLIARMSASVERPVTYYSSMLLRGDSNDVVAVTRPQRCREKGGSPRGLFCSTVRPVRPVNDIVDTYLPVRGSKAIIGENAESRAAEPVSANRLGPLLRVIVL